ncbi:Bifunctional glucose-6-phosphate/mannose-6-phosphate isomerase [Thermodesulfobium narugense DSM 14796]|uniref:Bifunctional glucose-6-phosphate/mannose-6-phosphate isomerase n=1 Tax=Thermodesulfobium narugense DSM 14796 TaxID=747365 RepID=M1E6Z3_9BACT|nr:SIS domain-containing protein [Thermodesulfobium narugense]AEE14393.1 Bifunctional glucose-6-phosphate/mannose-6-phosphate isomerase [Thermodesulfobium narugense DSM 14796]
MDKNVMNSYVSDIAYHMKDFYKDLTFYKDGKIDLNEIENLIFLGIGGSAISPKIFTEIMNINKKVYFFSTLNGFEALPDPSTSFVIAFSYSGNTVETLRSIELIAKDRFRGIGISSGGKIVDLCKSLNWQHIAVPKGRAPRAAMPFTLSILFKLALSKGWTEYNEDDFWNDIIELSNSKNNFLPEVDFEDNVSKRIAYKLATKKNVIIWGVESISKNIAYRFKSQLEENAKQLSYYSYLPEASHNQIVPISLVDNKEEYIVLIFRIPQLESVLVSNIISTVKTFLNSEGIEVLEVFGSGKNHVLAGLDLIYSTDFVSYYLALLKGIEPEPIEPISRMKVILNDNLRKAL